MHYSDESVALCALNKIFGYHPEAAISLIESAGSALALFDGSCADVAERVPGPALQGLLAQLQPKELEWGRQELERVDRQGYRFMGLYDEDYPEALRSCEAPPLGLYLNGSSSPTEIFGLRPMVGIVGTRDLSPYGRTWCHKLVSALSRADVQPCIVSGLAFGIDSVAHRTALECGIPTVGVMATGIDKVYPWQHSELAMSIVRTPGCGLVTDYPLETSPVALNFLRRNRIIAGLVSAVLVVESKTRGGSLMTAKYAVDYSRDVYALPGRADDIRSAGCNSLIASNMAQLITSPEELVGQLGLGAPVRGAGGSWRAGNGSARLVRQLERDFGPGSPAVTVALAVRAHRGILPDELATLAGLPIATVQETVSRLEIAGILTTDLLRRCSLSPVWE